jgi:ssDNA-binding Zn-finger/Zn-ribbon topoisomerase 1
MGKIRLRSCPRCNKGDVSLDKDQYGWYEYCLQCGYMRDMAQIARALPGRGGYLKDVRRGTRLSNRGRWKI